MKQYSSFSTWSATALFSLAVLLLTINIYGLFQTMRNPQIYQEEKTLRNRIADITIGYPAVKDSLARRPGESDRAFAVRVNTVVNNGFAHYWKEAGIAKYNLRVPIWENYLLYLASFVDPETYRRYEFTDYRKNLERGVGLCSSHAIVVKGVLNDHGIGADLWDIAGHVVVRAAVGGQEAIILDPDFGVVVPFDTVEIENNPELVRTPYKNLADLYYPDAIDPYTTDHVVEIYGRDGNHTYEVDNRFEPFSYYAIWIFPAMLMIPYLFILFNRRL